MYTRGIVRRTAVNAIALYLYLGKDSYRNDIIKESRTLIISPLAGVRLDIEELTITSVGITRGPCNHHAIITMIAGGHRIEAYCMISCDDRGPFLVSEVDVSVDGSLLSRRSFSVRNGILDPWGMPEGYDVQAAIEASTYAVDFEE